MTKKPINYNNSCIYKLCCNDKNITDCYVGSTTNFVKRKYYHKSDCNNKNSKLHHIKVYQFIRDNGGFDNWSMILLEKVKVNDGYELKKEERKYIETLNSTLNSTIPLRSKKEYFKEYYENNKEQIAEKNKEYREKNREKISEKRKERYENNKEKDKEYYENNKEKIINNGKERYENNKKEINERRKVKIECNFCKSIVRKDYLKTHRKSKKCIKAQAI